MLRRVAASSARLAASSRVAASPLAKFTHARSMAIAAGDKLPAVEVDYASWPPTAFNIGEYVAGKKVIIVGLPGAFTPT